MITHYVSRDEYRGLSSDDKPTNATNGDMFTEIDTGDIYYYDEDSQTWIVPGDSAEDGDDDSAEGGSV